MKKIIVFLFVYSTILVGCTNSAESSSKSAIKEKNNTKVEEISNQNHTIEFNNVEDAEKYLWNAIKQDKPYSNVKAILSDGHFVSEDNFLVLKNKWYKTAIESYKEVNGTEEEWEGLLNFKQDGGTFKRTQDIYFPHGQVYGYSASFEAVKGTYKLVELNVLYANN
ncbi:hypothetical protein GWK91_12775 [Virgibacillus sp. MSP4-1]|uniref:hypothetical protein n=1 Tax=Virgibacillus sp. MSP4-1 TaxID=2700081 RepID=UPI0005C48D30|nr:hypothetical protein [Virgibacillus sp. MSP4-1]QHS23768.1 hypothetical protein GWK91_12775 [Virgibacillus sp. MSP4-1]